MARTMADRTTHDAKTRLMELGCDQIQPSRHQARRTFNEDTLEELAASIRAQGIAQPVVVRPVPNAARGAATYEIVAGERRWRAASRIGLATIPAIVREASDEESAAIGLIENQHRDALNPVERARGIKRLVDEYGFEHAHVAGMLGLNRATVSNALRLLSLEPRVLRYIEEGQLENGRELLRLDDGGAQVRLAEEAIAKGWNRQQLSRAIEREKAGTGGTDKAKRGTKDANVERIQQRVSDHLGAPTTVKPVGKKGFELRVRTHSSEEITGVLEKMGLTFDEDGEIVNK